jgi:hypothetical protein
VAATFRQHIADEEGQVLRLLIEAYGKEGAEEAIKVFRQHRPIYALMQTVEKFSELEAQELSLREAQLTELLGDHALTEEKRIFPGAISASRVKPDVPRSPPV